MTTTNPSPKPKKKRQPKNPSHFQKGHQINSKGGLDKRVRILMNDELLHRLKLAYEVDAAFRLIPVKHRSFSDWIRTTLVEKSDRVLGRHPRVVQSQPAAPTTIPSLPPSPPAPPASATL